MATVLKPYLLSVLERASDELIKNMQRYVHTVTYVGATGKGAPGDPEWRDDLDRELKRLYEEATDKYLETGVGITYGRAYELVRAMLIAYGSGDKAVDPETGNNLGNPAIYAGPKGRQVWNNTLTGHVRGGSKIEKATPLPDEFNQRGNDFANRAIEELQAHFDAVVTGAMNNIPANVLAQCFTQ